MSESEIQDLLDQVSFSLGTLREAKSKFSAQLAPDFRIFDYLRDDEMGLSKCFADLLNPKGKHGQGSLFLDSFLKLIDWTSTATNCKVELEKQANGMRRIDVFLRFDEGFIGIENKPWAGDQDSQLHDYADYLSHSANGKDWKLIYLCNGEPSEQSIKSEKRHALADEHHFLHLTYESVVDWLESCAAQSKALVIRVYVEELAKYVRGKVIGEMDMNEMNEVSKIVSMTSKNLEASFDIANALTELKEQLLKRFKSELVSAVQAQTGISLGDELKWNVKGDKWWNVARSKANTGFTIWIETKKFEHVALRFAFENTDYRNFFWGITSYAEKRYADKRPVSDLNKSNAIFELMKPEFNLDDANKTDWWTCWGWPQGAVSWKRNWNNQSQPWAAIADQTLASEIVIFARRVQNCLNQ